MGEAVGKAVGEAVGDAVGKAVGGLVGSTLSSPPLHEHGQSLGNSLVTMAQASASLYGPLMSPTFANVEASESLTKLILPPQV